MNDQQRDKSMETANKSSIYSRMILGTAVSVLGVFLRFAYDSLTLSIVSWAILFIGAFIACNAVFKILNAK